MLFNYPIRTRPYQLMEVLRGQDKNVAPSTARQHLSDVTWKFIERIALVP